MSLPGNGIFVVQGEMSMLVTAMRRSTRWGSHSFPNEEYDMLMRTFQELKTILYQVDDLRLLDPATYLSPFLEVIRSKETTGPVTNLALSAVNKFLSYGLIDPAHPSVPATVEDIADAVTHARFVGTDHSSDGVVLMKILQVLRTLMLSPVGVSLTDESVCEIMLSCFRICFETRLTELLRRNAEQCLRDMTQLIFMRLPDFPPEDSSTTFAGAGGLSLKKREKTYKKKSVNSANNAGPSLVESRCAAEHAAPTLADTTPLQDKNLLNEAEITIEPVSGAGSPQHARHSSMDLAAHNSSITQLLHQCVAPEHADTQHAPEHADTQHAPEHADTQPDILLDTKADTLDTRLDIPPDTQADALPELQPLLDADPTSVTSQVAVTDGAVCSVQHEEAEGRSEAGGEGGDAEGAREPLEEFVNDRGIRFTPHHGAATLKPYGLPCVRELFRFVVGLCGGAEGGNTSWMVQLGLSLVQCALEVAAPRLAADPALLQLVRDPLARTLIALLSTERISIFALDLQVTFLLYESLRVHLKYQIEAFFKKMIEIVSCDTSKAAHELKEIQHLAIEGVSQLLRIPGLCAELYLNYDCDVYCADLFEELAKLLSANVLSAAAYDTHALSLDALLAQLEAAEQGAADPASAPASGLPSHRDLDDVKNIKKWVRQGTELFNSKPERGIEFLQEHGVLATPLDPHQVAVFLRENPDLDKKMIGEYICKRSSRGELVLSAFADSFQFAGLRIDSALRLYLETFRLPGEAPLIFLLMEKFAERWHTSNGCPFANPDAAFRLAYAIIMLNMDQHNHNAKKLNVPMTVEDFVKNLRGCNGSGDFEQAMLEQVYHSIKNEEMVMPAERVGPVRDAYLWRVLQRRPAHYRALCPALHAAAPAARRAAPHPYHDKLFALLCPPIVAALSAAFERAPAPSAEEARAAAGTGAGAGPGAAPALVALAGLERVATLVARVPVDSLTLDSLLLSLVKFTGLLHHQNSSYITIGVSLGQSVKSQMSLLAACGVAARLGGALRTAWLQLLRALGVLYRGRVLPAPLVEAEDYLAPEGRVSLLPDTARAHDAGLLSSLYSYIALGDTGTRAPTPQERALIESARECVLGCNLHALLVTETKFLPLESLQALVAAMAAAGAPPDPESLQLNPELEDVAIFFLELLGQTLIQNRDRVLAVWGAAGAAMGAAVQWAAGAGAGSRTLRRVLCAVLRCTARVMRAEACAPTLVQHLTLLFTMPKHLFFQHADLISCGVYEVVKTSAQNVHGAAEWEVLLALLCAAGAGAWPADSLHELSSRSGSEEEMTAGDTEQSPSPSSQQGWILVQRDEDSGAESGAEEEAEAAGAGRAGAVCVEALQRCVEALALVVRDLAHVTPYNCRAVVSALRILARAAYSHGSSRESKRADTTRRAHDDEDELADTYHLISLQLLDLMHTLHSRAAQIFAWWRDEVLDAPPADLWELVWRPLLQAMARLCTHRSAQVCGTAMRYLQRALLAPGLGHLEGAAWEACVARVLIPLVRAVAGAGAGAGGCERAARANTLACKVVLQHLGALVARPSWAGLWRRVLRLQADLVRDPRDPLAEAATESLKNLILVMDSVQIFSTEEGHNELWYMTWDIVDQFLPNLKRDMFPDLTEDGKQAPNPLSHMQGAVPLPTIVPAPPPAPHPAPPPAHTPAHTPGTVPIRNPLYDQAGLTSSVLLQPLNEMISTPIGVSLESQMPVVYPEAAEAVPAEAVPAEQCRREESPAAVPAACQSESSTFKYSEYFASHAHTHAADLFDSIV